MHVVTSCLAPIDSQYISSAYAITIDAQAFASFALVPDSCKHASVSLDLLHRDLMTQPRGIAAGRQVLVLNICSHITSTVDYESHGS